MLDRPRSFADFAARANYRGGVRAVQPGVERDVLVVVSTWLFRWFGGISVAAVTAT